MTLDPTVVVGAGIIGLTTAVRLAEAGAPVSIISADDPLATTSVLASAMVGPSFGARRELRWADATAAVFLGPDATAPGVALRRGRLIAEPEGFVHPDAPSLPGFALCSGEETPAGYGTAFWVEVPLVDMARYLTHLVERALGLGVRIERGRLATLEEAAALAPQIVNGAGLGARDLAADDSVTPLRGPKIVVANPGLDTFLISGPPGPSTTCFHPHGDIVVVGGSAIESWDTTPDPAEATAIIERCAAIEPLLRGAEVIEHSVGLRPARSAPRMELVSVGSSRIVHNYGHGGSGVTFSWGCAADAVQLLARGT